MGIFEILIITDDIRELVLKKAGDVDLELDARETENVLNTFNEIQGICVPFIFNVELIIQIWPEINNSLNHLVNNNEKLYDTVNSTLTKMRETVVSTTMLTAGTLRYLVEGITKNIFIYSRYRDEKYLVAGSEKIKKS
jgi:hypothetical protein